MSVKEMDLYVIVMSYAVSMVASHELPARYSRKFIWLWSATPTGCSTPRQQSMCMQLGSDPTAAEVQAVKDYVQEHRSGVKVVQADWLRQCGKQRSLLPASHNYLVPLSSLTAPPARLVSDKQEVQKVPAGLMGAGQEADSGDPHAGQQAPGGGADVDECEAAVGSQAPKHQALKGLW